MLWESLGITQIMDEVTGDDRSGSAVLEILLRRQDVTLPGFEVGLKEVIAIGCWYLWWIRRQRTHNEQVPPMFKCKMSILTIASNSSKVLARPSTPCQEWSRPPSRIIKVNVDGSFHPDVHAGSTGAVLRDHDGRFVAASSSFLPNIASVAVAEAMAMREGLRLKNHMGCNNIQVESDSMETVEACTGEATWWNESSAIFADCVDLIALIGGVQIQFCPREANEVAHEIARDCFNSKISCNWVDEPPCFIIPQLISDVTKL
jgi:ribonuclease HI